MTTFVVIFVGSNLVKHVGWRAGALATPLSMAALAAPLFAVIVATQVGPAPIVHSTFFCPVRIELRLFVLLLITICVYVCMYVQ